MANDLPGTALSVESDDGSPLAADVEGSAGEGADAGSVGEPDAPPAHPGAALEAHAAAPAAPPGVDDPDGAAGPARQTSQADRQGLPLDPAAVEPIAQPSLPSVVVVGGAAAPGGDAAGPAVYTPRPRPPIRPERDADGGGVHTDGITIERAQGRAAFVTIRPAGSAPQRIYVHPHLLEKLLALATSPNWEPGRLWRTLCDIPLERPLPNRRLEEELRALLTTFELELRS